MHKYLSTLLLLITVTTSVPTPTDLVPRQCVTVPPSSIDILSLNNPNTPSLGTHIALTREANPSRNTKTVALTFEQLPSSATGCTLQLAIPKLTEDDEIASGTATQARIWKTEPWTSNDPPTWNDPAQNIRPIATTPFPTAKTDGNQVAFLASDSCSETMGFFIELDDWQAGEREVDFENRISGGDDDLGFRMVYGC